MNALLEFFRRCAARCAAFAVSRPEMFLVRLGLALVVWNIFPTATFPEQPVPNGLARLGLDFTWLHDPGAVTLCRGLLAVALVCHVLDRAARPALLVITFLLVASGTLTNSQSEQVTHSTQPVTLVVLAQAVWFWIEPRWRRGTGAAARLERQRTGFRAAMLTLCAAYMVSVVSKLVESDGKWFSRAANIPVQLEKNRLADYYNQAGRVAAGDGSLAESTRDWFIGHPWAAGIVLGGGLVLEALCFLALTGRRAAAATGVLLILFHLTIAAVMNLTFKFNIALLLIYFVGLPYWLTLPLRRRPGTAGVGAPAALV
jgi:hypothetical protein